MIRNLNKNNRQRQTQNMKKKESMDLYLLTCNAPTLGQLNCLRLLCYQRQHEHDDEIREQHSKMDSYANAIPCSGTEVFDVLQ